MALTPQEIHERRHQAEVPMPECWRCARNVRKCGGKITYPDWPTAFSVSVEVNVKREWSTRVLPYKCNYCDGYHLATARGKHEERKAEKVRRKVLRGRIP